MEQTIVIPDENVEIYDVVEEINHEHELCIGSMRNSIEHALRVGELLNEQKQRIPEGEWMLWIKMNCSFSYKQAWKYSRLASNISSRGYFENANSIGE